MKNRIRKEILQKRKMLGEREWSEKSGKIQEGFLNSGFYKKAGNLLLYCHFDREVKTDTIISDAVSAGKIVCVPFNDWDRNTFVPSRIHSLKDLDYGGKIPMPFVLDPFPREKIELAVIPGVVFDVHGNRIGMGKGFYDRFMKEDQNNILKVSLAFDFQVMKEKLPVDPWDRCVDMIITENRIIECR